MDAKAPYQEIDLTNPLNVYGQSNSLVRKRSGELRSPPHPPHQLGLGSYGKVTLSKPCLLGSRAQIRVVADQIGSPTWTGTASAIAQLIPQLKYPDKSTYHYTNSGVASWYDCRCHL